VEHFLVCHNYIARCRRQLTTAYCTVFNENESAMKVSKSSAYNDNNYANLQQVVIVIHVIRFQLLICCVFARFSRTSSKAESSLPSCFVTLTKAVGLHADFSGSDDSWHSATRHSHFSTLSPAACQHSARSP